MYLYYSHIFLRYLVLVDEEYSGIKNYANIYKDIRYIYLSTTRHLLEIQLSRFSNILNNVKSSFFSFECVTRDYYTRT